MEEYAGIDIKYFKVIGLWQFIMPTRNGKYAVIFSALIGTIFTVHISIQMINTLTSNYDFSIFTEKLSVNLTCFESAIKILYYCWNRSCLINLISLFRKNLLICSTHDPKMATQILTNSAKFVNTCTKSFVYMIFCTVGVWNSLPVLRCLISGDCESWHIMPSWYPFNTKQIPMNIIVYCFEFLIMGYCAALLYTVNCFFSALALTVAAQFQLLGTSFAAIEKHADEYVTKMGLTDKKEKQIQMYKLLRECLMDHQILLRFTKDLEEMYNPMFLFQMLTSTFTICLVLVQLNVHLASSEDLPIAMACKFIMYLLFGSMELLVYSWGGQIVFDQSGAVHWNMYESGWAEGSLRFRKSLVFAMARSYKPEALTAGKFYNVDLNSFTQVIKASYSYFTFLHGSGSLKSSTK